MTEKLGLCRALFVYLRQNGFFDEPDGAINPDVASSLGAAVKPEHSWYLALKIVPALPAGSNYPSGGEDILAGLVGATIVRMGSTEDDGLEGGGLIIDYRPHRSDTVRRIVLAFNENGAWVEYDGPLPIPASIPQQ